MGDEERVEVEVEIVARVSACSVAWKYSRFNRDCFFVRWCVVWFDLAQSKYGRLAPTWYVQFPVLQIVCLQMTLSTYLYPPSSLPTPTNSHSCHLQPPPQNAPLP